MVCFRTPDYNNEANVSDIQRGSNKTKTPPSNHELLTTGVGVDIHDPEERAKNEFYKDRLEIFQQIEAINKSKNYKLYIHVSCLLKSFIHQTLSQTFVFLFGVIFTKRAKTRNAQMI